MSVSIFKEILDNNSVINVCNGLLTIKEIDNDRYKGKLREVTITNLLINELCSYKMDLHHPLSKYLSKQNNRGINRGVDAVLILEKGINNNYIIFFELKSNKVKTSEVANKYFASTSFIHHINLLLEKFYDKSISSYSASAVLLSLKSYNNRLKKLEMRPDELSYENKIYKNSIGKAIQVLEIKKNTSSNFKVSINNILNESRFKSFKNWP